MDATEKVIVEPFPYWEKAVGSNAASGKADSLVIVGCGTSLNLALSLAACANSPKREAIAVPGARHLNKAVTLS
jgi:glucosamine--fructose-6-phosphate aminotransferase (isomerizing)